MVKDDPLEQIAQHLNRGRRFSIIDERMIGNLSLVDPRSYQAGLWGQMRRVFLNRFMGSELRSVPDIGQSYSGLAMSSKKSPCKKR